MEIAGRLDKPGDPDHGQPFYINPTRYIMFWSETPSHIAIGEALQIHVHDPELVQKAITVRAGNEQVLLGLDDAGKAMARFYPDVNDGEHLLVLSAPGQPHHPIWIGGDVPEKYRGEGGELIIPVDEDPGEDPDPDLSLKPESSSVHDEESERRLRAGEEALSRVGNLESKVTDALDAGDEEKAKMEVTAGAQADLEGRVTALEREVARLMQQLIDANPTPPPAADPAATGDSPS